MFRALGQEIECQLNLYPLFFMNVLNLDRNFDILAFVRIKFSTERQEVSPFPI